MTPEEIQELARRIAEVLARRESDSSLPPAAPGPHHARPSYREVTVAARAAAAGRGPSPLPGGSSQVVTARGSAGASVPVAVSNRHIHLSQAHVDQLFGASHGLSEDRAIKQPGQFAAKERVRIVGPAGGIDGVRVVGPARGDTVVELAAADAKAIGVEAPLRSSTATQGSAPIRLEGPAGAVDLPQGAIVHARHLHVGPHDSARLGLADGDRVDLVVGTGDRRATLHGVLVRAGATHATELHLDTDDARAFGIATGATAELLRASRTGRSASKGHLRVVTERDVDAIAAAGQTVSRGPGCVITPAAIDRAKALGVWRG
jgi:putative phosphotransacetylase